MKYISYQTIYHAIADFQMAEYATVGSGKAFDALNRVLAGNAAACRHRAHRLHK